MTQFRTFVLFFTLAILPLSTSDSWAIVVARNAGNTTAPTEAELTGGDPGFIHVAQLNTASAVYLGYGWMLTAGHVGAGDVIIDGATYAYKLGSAVTLNSLDNYHTPYADLKLFRLDDIPRLPTLAISSTYTPRGSQVVLIGQCSNYQETETGWSKINNSWTEVTPASDGDVQGFKSAAGRSIRWGTNLVDKTGELVQTSSGSSNWETRSYVMDFDQSGTAYEAQAVSGDSGGAVFRRVSGKWELSGITIAANNVVDKPTEALALFGWKTYSAELYRYRDQILDIITPLVGDATLDGIVDEYDAEVMAANWLTATGALWIDGDFNEDGAVNDADAAILSANWLRTSASYAAAVFSAVPEPGPAIFLLSGLAILIVSRKQRKWKHTASA